MSDSDNDLRAEGTAPVRQKAGFWKRLCRTILFLLLITVCLAGYFVWDMWQFLQSPAESIGREISILILPGATFAQITRNLYENGALRDPARFRLYAGWRKQLSTLQAGEFIVNTGWTPQELLSHLTSGQALQHRLLIREGLTWWEVAALIEAAGFAKAEDVKEFMHDPEFLAKNHIPFSNAEGFLYPETYLLLKPREMDKPAAKVVVQAMVDMFWKKTAPRWAEEAERLKRVGELPEAEQEAIHAAYADAQTAADSKEWVPHSSMQGIPKAQVQRLLILASLVERETALEAERARVAGVYTNRMRSGMLLQCDPTIIYGLGDRFTGNLTRAHIQDKANRYNTYQHLGLPPGPICSPGYASLAAAFEPEEHKYFYFVAKGAGLEHQFSTNLREHNQAVRTYQLRRSTD